MKRLDVLLVELGLAPTRNKASQLIESGEVQLQIRGEWKVASQASFNAQLLLPEQIRIAEDSQTLKYVSRGGLKLEAALRRTQLRVVDLRALDIGISTGGFTDCLLQHGVAQVLGVDVGHGQLHPRLEGNPRVLSFEGVHVRDLAAHEGVRAWLSQGLGLCVVDVSFISLSHVFPVLSEILLPGTKLLALVKPQFEVGRANLDKHGLVQNKSLFDEVKGRVLHSLQKCGFSVLDYFPCDVKGQDGNQEFFVYADRN